jgi:hypothetical protein
MSIELRGGGCYVSMDSSVWGAVQKIARKFGWTPKFKRKTGVETGLGYDVHDVEEDNARELASALYRAIQAVETDCLSEPLVKLVKEARVRTLRDVADLASVSYFYIG